MTDWMMDRMTDPMTDRTTDRKTRKERTKERKSMRERGGTRLDFWRNYPMKHIVLVLELARPQDRNRRRQRSGCCLPGQLNMGCLFQHRKLSKSILL